MGVVGWSESLWIVWNLLLEIDNGTTVDFEVGCHGCECHVIYVTFIYNSSAEESENYFFVFFFVFFFLALSFGFTTVNLIRKDIHARLELNWLTDDSLTNRNRFTFTMDLPFAYSIIPIPWKYPPPFFQNHGKIRIVVFWWFCVTWKLTWWKTKLTPAPPSSESWKRNGGVFSRNWNDCIVCNGVRFLFLCRQNNSRQ